MQPFRNLRLILLALLVSVSAVSIHAQFGVAINVGFAPPVLPVYVQPMCPQPNLMWTPGYWAYSNDDGDYYFVPGAWVEPAYSGALWTPPYWGFSGGQYGFHGGYWGQSVGYYGGVNYGFGFGGIGFAGGEWRGGTFAYNTAVVSVNTTYIHTTYVNRTIVESGIVANPNHVSYNGGPGGIQHAPTATEQAAAHQKQTPPTAIQSQHETTAKADKTSFAKANGGHPANVVAAKPLTAHKAAPVAASKNEARPVAKVAPKAAVQPHAAPAAHSAPAAAKTQAKPAAHAAPAAAKTEAKPASHAAPAAVRTQAKPAVNPAPKPMVRQKTAPAAHVAPVSRVTPAPRAATAQHAAPVHAAPAQHAAAAPKAAPKEESGPEKK